MTQILFELAPRFFSIPDAKNASVLGYLRSRDRHSPSLLLSIALPTHAEKTLKKVLDAFMLKDSSSTQTSSVSFRMSERDRELISEEKYELTKNIIIMSLKGLKANEFLTAAKTGTT